jgi:hypothetical protein
MDKYFLHIINEMENVVGPLKDLLYIYRCRDMIISNMNSSCK